MPTDTMKRLLVYQLLHTVLYCVQGIGGDEEVKQRCAEGCSQIVNDVNFFDDLKCNSSCRQIQCQNGCEVWRKSAEPCSRACNISTRNQNQLQFCASGCNLAMDIYAETINASLGILKRPTLVPRNLSHSSVILHWEGPVANLTYHLQGKFAQFPDTWKYFDDVKQLGGGDMLVENLRPYVQYKFRIMVVITPRHILETPESYAIRTQPFGVPDSRPILTSLTSESPTVIQVSWQPPMFPSGPVKGYDVELSNFDNPGQGIITKDIGSQTSCTFTGLKPSTQYSLRIAAVNMEGAGPAVYGNITTRRLGNDSYSTPFLVFSAAKVIYRLNLEEIVEADAHIIAAANSSITGVAVHVWKEFVFFSDQSYSLSRLSLIDSLVKVIYTSFAELGGITVDWLNDKVYFMEGQNISRCSLDGSHWEPVVTGLGTKPSTIYVDPYHDKGYLYWTQNGATETRGIYRVTLSEISAGVIHPTPSQHQVVKSYQALSTVSLDLQNFVLYYPDDAQSSLIQTTLDGMDEAIVREDVTLQVQDLVYFNGSFYMSDGMNINYEEYDSGQDQYYYNEIYNSWVSPVTGMCVLHPLAQPVPVPSHWPTQLQVIFSSRIGVISWKLPSKGFGSGSMSRYLWFTLKISESGTGQILSFDRIQNLSYNIENLKPNTTYSIKIRASSDGGEGPWSPVFKGKTLHEGVTDAKITLANPSGLYFIDTTGGNLQQVLNTTGMEGAITDICSWGEHYILTWSNRKAYIYNTSTDTLSELPHIKLSLLGTAVAVDWIGDKIYWASHNSVIYRSNLNGSYIEPVYQLTEQVPVKDLVIDAEGGYVYWSTSHTVECSRLNGEGHFYFVKNLFWSIPQILGLTLDLEKKQVFWLEVDMTKSYLYSASMAVGSLEENPTSTTSLISKIETVSRLPILQFFQGHLYFLDENCMLTVSNERGEYLAEMSLALQDLSAVKLIHPSLGLTGFFQKSTNLVDINVVPSVIPYSSVVMEGQGSEFKVIWAPEKLHTYGNVFYEVSIEFYNFEDSQVVSEPYIMMHDVPPYTSLSLTLTPYTYWHRGTPTLVTLRSPVGVPGQPSYSNAFVTHKKDIYGQVKLTTVEFHWRKPDRENGILIAYKLMYIIGTGSRIQPHLVELLGNVTIFKLNGTKNEVYSFQVQACTSAGCGEYSDQVVVQTSSEVPAPKLLLSMASSIVVYDADRGEADRKVTTTSSVVTSAYIAYENTFFWFDSTNKLWKNHEMNLGPKSLFVMENQPQTLAADWVGRVLYWAAFDDQAGGSTVWSLDLNREDEGGVQEIYHTNRNIKIQQLFSNPLESKLSWLEENRSGIYRLIEWDLITKRIKQVLPPIYGNQTVRRRKRNTNCNCPMDSAVGTAVAMLVREDGKPEYYWMDTLQRQLLMSDSAGCICQLKMNSSVIAQLGFMPSSLSIDSEFIYFLNKTEGILSMLSRDTGIPVQILHVPETTHLEAFGAHRQPMPDPICLLIGNYSEVPDKIAVQNDSITLQIPAAQFPDDCSSVSIPTIEYLVFYGQENGSSDLVCDKSMPRPSCGKQVSAYAKELTLAGLVPYTSYRFQLAASNYYSALSDRGPPVIFKTKAGIPSEAVNVKTKTLTPEEIEVSWELPLNPHGPPSDITYSVVWMSLDYPGRVVSGQTPKRVYNGLKTKVENLTAAVNYNFQVLAYDPAGEYYSISKEANCTTFEYPGSLKFQNISSHSITVSWMPPQDGSVLRHSLQYAEVKTPLVWKQGTQSVTQVNHLYIQTFKDLTPNTKYAFSVRALLSSYRSFVFGWPKDSRFSRETTASIPAEPIPPKLNTLSTDTYEVFWYPPEDRGAKITQYMLQYMPDDISGNWSLAYKGVSTKWKAQGLDGGQKYIFRVAAKNAVGWGPFSTNSSSFFLPVVAAVLGSEDSSLTAILVSLFTVIAFLVVLAALVLFRVFKKKRGDRNTGTPFMNHNGHQYDAPRTPDIELATLRELPRIAYHTNITLYGMGMNPSKDEIAALPHFRRDQLTLTQLLGSGAFGEVYEGEATDVMGHLTGPTKVAVKTLKRSANDSEKEEFLKEALLMSNFKHNHILRLLGVCLDNDPQFIILELMDGGDLLSFLRTTRPAQAGQSALTFPDLICICCDVAKGCSYLEDLHFVHRDIAARNCLVSQRDNRITVKIGDFGLARDIYRNDYYRKEGEGLLPVRWMSPEALIDGVFTIQSDVWAYGVLVWEVLTLGQQPYPARTNLEVLHFVRGGGRLDRPENCPDELHDLTLKCWNFDAKDRPTFHHIEERLVHFMELAQVPDSVFSGTVKVRRLSGGCFDNPAFAVDVENNNKYQQQQQLQQQLPNMGLSVEIPGAENNSNKQIGGSVKLTPTSKRKRLQSLIGGADLDSSSESAEVQDSSSGSISQKPRKKKTRRVKSAVSMDHMHGHRLRGITYRTPSNANDYLTARHHSPHRYLELLPDGGPCGHDKNKGGASADKVNYSQVVSGLSTSTPNVNGSSVGVNKDQQTLNYAQISCHSDDALSNDDEDDDVEEEQEHSASHPQLHDSQDSLNDCTSNTKLNYAALALVDTAASEGSAAEDTEVEEDNQKTPPGLPGLLNYADLMGAVDDNVSDTESDEVSAPDTDEASGSGVNSPENQKDQLQLQVDYANINSTQCNPPDVYKNGHNADRVRYANLPESENSDDDENLANRKPLFKEPHPNKNRKITRPHRSNNILVFPDYSSVSKKKDGAHQENQRILSTENHLNHNQNNNNYNHTYSSQPEKSEEIHEKRNGENHETSSSESAD